MTPEERIPLIIKLRRFPGELRAALSTVPDAELTAESIPGEWTVAQVVHHLADAHMNAYIRFKLVLVEDYPTFKPYEQEDWAETAEAVSNHIEESLVIIQGLHGRWTCLMDSMTESQWQRKGLHPVLGEISLDGLLEGYARHSQNHLDQILKILKAISH